MAISFTGTAWLKMEFHPEDDENVLAALGPLEGQDWWMPDRGTGVMGKIEFTSGAGDLQMDRFWYDRRTITLSTGNDELDLYGGLTWAGNTINFKEIKLLVVHNRGMINDSDDSVTPTDGEDILIGAAGSDAWSSIFAGDDNATLLLRSGATEFVISPYQGYSVSPNTGDKLLIAHAGSVASGGDISYDILIGGVQA